MYYWSPGVSHSYDTEDISRLVTVTVEEDQINTPTCSPVAFIRQKGIGRHYGLHIIWMPSFLWPGEKGAVFMSGGERCGFCGWRSACKSAQEAEAELTVYRFSSNSQT